MYEQPAIEVPRDELEFLRATADRVIAANGRERGTPGLQFPTTGLVEVRAWRGRLDELVAAQRSVVLDLCRAYGHFWPVEFRETLQPIASQLIARLSAPRIS